MKTHTTRYEAKLLQASSKGSFKRARRLFKRPHAIFYSVSNADGDDDDSEPSTYCKNANELSSPTRKTKERSKKENRRSKSYKHRIQKYGLDVNCSDSNQWTPLHHAAYLGSIDIVKYLLKKGARYDLKDGCGNTPLILAAEKGHELIVHFLKEAGADMEEENVFGKSATSIYASRRASSFPEPSYRNSNEWTDRLQSALFEDEDEFGNSSEWWEDVNDEDSLPKDADEQWREDIVEAMKRKASANSNFSSQSKDGLKHDKGGEDDKQKKWKKLLEEERAKDMEWRKKALESTNREKQEDYESRWKKFASSSNVMLTISDIPFPFKKEEKKKEDEKEEGLRKLLLQSVPIEAQKKRMRMEILRWHPDKFFQIWGQRMLPAQKEEIMLRVKDVSQMINSIYSQIS